MMIIMNMIAMVVWVINVCLKLEDKEYLLALTYGVLAIFHLLCAIGVI